LLLLFILSLAFAGLLFGQRAGRGIITGLVTDPVGAAVPDATVTVTGEVSGFKFTVGTSGDGNYGTPLLALGTYTVQVEKAGFKTYIRKGIDITSGIEYRQDVTLELGAITQTVEVKAASQMINVQTADIGHTLNQRYYQDLPIVMGTDIRLAESMLMAQPGYTPMEPNGDPMFRGSGFNSRINGGQTMSVESFIDGASFGYTNGHNETHESSPPVEAIAEMRMDTGSFSAQYGHTSGGFIEYTTKSGTNDFHGSVYEYAGNKALNARGFFAPTRVPYQNNSYGVTAGGPIVIPHLYNGKNRTYVFGNYDLTNLRTGVGQNYDNVLPSALEKAGNFSELLSYGSGAGTPSSTCGANGDSACVDALGRPINNGEIYDPSSIRQVTKGAVDPVTGITAIATGPVRDPIPGNIISNSPGAMGLLSTVGGKVNALQPTTPGMKAGIGFNALGTAFGDPNGRLDPKTFLLRVDHQIKPNFKMYTTWYQNARPAIRNCNGPQGCNTSHDAENDPQANTEYIGPGFYQRISVRNLHQQFDWVIKPNLFNHTTVAYDRWYMGAHGLSDGVGWIQQLGLDQSNGQTIPTYGPNGKSGAFPTLNFNGGWAPGVSQDGNGWVRGYETTNRWQFLDDLSWIKGKHTIKVGYEYRHHQTPQDGWNRGITGAWTFDPRETAGIDNTGSIRSGFSGDAYASMLLGQVDNANFTDFQPGTWREAYTALFINDEFKVTPKLSMTIGLRYDYMFPRTEAHDRYSTFSPTTPNPGASGIPGAMLFAGTGPGRTGSRTFETPLKNDWGPRLGLAYRITNKDVIRAGYGMYYSGISFNYSAPGGYPDEDIGATYPTASNLAAGLYPAFYWDAPGTGTKCPTYLAGAPAPVGCGFPAAQVIAPPIINPSVANGGDARGVHSDSLDLPRYENWNFTYERQLTSNSSWYIAYIGNRGTRLPMRGDALGPGTNMGYPQYLSYGSDALSSAITSATAQALPAVQAMPMYGGLHLPFASYTGNVAQALRPFPQYTSVTWRSGFPGGESHYNAIQTQYERRFSAGLQLRVAYTWSRLINNGAENGLIWSAPVQNPVNDAAEKGLSADDVPSTLVLSYTYALPFGKGQRWVNQGGVANQVIGGWHIAGIQRYNSGRPVDVTMADDMGSFVYNNQKRPNYAGGGCWKGGKYDPAVDAWYNNSGWTDPGNLVFGDAARTGPCRDEPVYNEDFNVFKEFPIHGEAVKLRFETQFGNAFNRHFLCDPSNNGAYDTWNVPSFGHFNSMCNQPRHIDFGLKLYW
jgi:hypothetical protein